MSFFRPSLSEKLTQWKRKYAKGRYQYDSFDWKNIDVSIFQDWNGKYSVRASVKCSGLGGNIDIIAQRAHIYERCNKFLSRIEAEAHVEAEIRKATREHPQTAFYRERLITVVTDGVVNNDVHYYEHCINGKWIPTPLETDCKLNLIPK